MEIPTLAIFQRTEKGEREGSKLCFIRGYLHVASFLFPVSGTKFPDYVMLVIIFISLHRTSRIGETRSKSVKVQVVLIKESY